MVVKVRPIVTQRKVRDDKLRSQVRALVRFPHIKVRDWMPLVRDHYQLEE